MSTRDLGADCRGWARCQFEGGWYGVLQGKTGYSLFENQLDSDDARSAEILGPLVGGVLVNFDAEVAYFEGEVTGGRRWVFPDGSFFQLEAGVVGVSTDPVVTADPVQDRITETHYERLSAAVEVPLQGHLFGRSLVFGVRLRHTFLDRDLSIPMESDGFTDMRLTLLTLSPVLYRGQEIVIGGLGVVYQRRGSRGLVCRAGVSSLIGITAQPKKQQA